MNRHLLKILSVFLLISCNSAFSQRAAQVGIFAGTAYYMGDINPNRHFYRPSLSLGFLYRYNLNARYAVKASANYGQFSGSDLDFPKLLHPDRPMSPASFQTSLIDVSLQVEFNFLPFTTGIANWAYTPYISTGISGALILSSDRASENMLNLPFGIGVKVNLTKRMTAGAEWSFRKSFNDKLDGLENPSGVYSVLHNNDWYSFLGVIITYKFFNFAVDCPVYK
jgi:opacity protein-like surface antigen